MLTYLPARHAVLRKGQSGLSCSVYLSIYLCTEILLSSQQSPKLGKQGLPPCLCGTSHSQQVLPTCHLGHSDLMDASGP